MLTRLFPVVLLSLSSSVWSQNEAGTTPATVGFGGYPEATDFEVVERPLLTIGVWPDISVPCTFCHQALITNPTPRALPPPHPALNHGDGRMWCLNCHNPDDRDQLRDFLGNDVAAGDAHLVCGQCHFDQQKDWYFGAHGKRVENWRGKRRIYACAHCHDPHDPAIKPRAPLEPPPVRVGLTREEGDRHAPQLPWQRGAATGSEETKNE